MGIGPTQSYEENMKSPYRHFLDWLVDSTEYLHDFEKKKQRKKKQRKKKNNPGNLLKISVFSKIIIFQDRRFLTFHGMN